ncbi:DMT family transporter [Wenjunlia tyrosinilytica]|uniref:QacE family quaternary ammonium compound efflux SMR transporter n=1 Tax=Wenjunlia tyrosinilytica TaxID=1544741 RepID=A0A917ZZQ5_9ACTN|nr:SMR family transporter [Wenjunlia tyrosinilytica]GGO98946.1 QacE family quaternary ammonium compound efflux SMR transporter [Wenjunlia tyrosinilytica]
MTWLLLACAIAAEVTATVALRSSEGFSRIVPSAVVLVGYSVSFYLLSRVLTRGMALGVVYGIWSAIGVTLVAVIGAISFGDKLTWTQVGGIALVVAGVLALEMGGAH